MAAPLISRFSPQDQHAGSALAGISGAHPLGTDEFGRDLLSRLVYGLRIDMELIAIAVPIGAVVGTGLALLCSLNRRTDVASQRLFDVILAFPRLVLALAIATIVGAGPAAIVVTVVVVDVPVFGRLTRTALLSLRGREFVLAADTLGTSRMATLRRHILPNAVDALVVQAALSAAQAVVLEGSMSFLGVGVRAPQPSLGGILQGSVPFLATNPTYALGPILAFVALTASCNLIADGLTKGLRG